MTNRQRALFESLAGWEEDAQADLMLAEVVFVEGLDGTFDYRVPDALRRDIVAGKRVRVPLGRGNRQVVGFCVGVNTRTVAQPDRYKSISAVLDRVPLLSATMLALTRRMSDYYVTRWGRVMQSVVPGSVMTQAGTRMTTVYTIAASDGGQGTGRSLSAGQQAVVDLVKNRPRGITGLEIRQILACGDSPIRTLHRRGVLAGRKERRFVDPAHTDITTTGPGQEEAEQPPQLNDSQSTAVRTIVDCLRDGRHQTYVLRGVTGSGKTEVYIRAIEEVIRFGRQAIVLVPEISLTPQTQRRFRARFPDVAVLHSMLSDADRHRHWQRIAAGESQVVVGARSAVFAPTPHLGIVILDEEHDASFKQDQVPRYHARSVAQWRAEMQNIPLVLGSATPSLESWHATQSGSAELISMPHRVLDRRLPDVSIIDQSVEYRSRGPSGPISSRLRQAIKTALKQREQ